MLNEQNLRMKIMLTKNVTYCGKLGGQKGQKKMANETAQHILTPPCISVLFKRSIYVIYVFRCGKKSIDPRHALGGRRAYDPWIVSIG